MLCRGDGPPGGYSIARHQTGGPDLNPKDEVGCPTCRGYTWVFASLTFLLPESCRNEDNLPCRAQRNLLLHGTAFPSREFLSSLPATRPPQTSLLRRESSRSLPLTSSSPQLSAS